MPNWKKLITSGSDANLNTLNATTAVTASNLSVTDTATYNTVEFTNSNIMKFNQRYTGAAAGSYFTNGEYQKVVTITPAGSSENYQVVGRITAQNAGETHTVFFNAALRSNTLPDLDYTINYEEEYNGSRYIDPQLWVKETSTAGFIIAFKTLGTIYGSVTIDFDVIPRSTAQKANVTINQVLNSEQTSIDTGFTAFDMQRNLRNQSGNFTISGSVTADSFNGSDVSLTNTTADSAVLTLTTTEDSSNAGPVITLKRNSSSPADADYIGQLKFKGENDADQEVVYAKITGKIKDASDGSEDGNIEFANRRGGLNVITARLTSEKLQLLNGTDLDVDGQVSASSYIGDGSGLTNVTSNITEEVTVSQTFTSATTASVNHLFGTKDVIVTVYDDNDDQFLPSRINTPDTNNVNIYMDPATTGRVVVAKGGHLVSGSIHKHLMTSVTSSTITHNLQEEFPVVQVYESASREMFIPETIKSIDENNTQVVLSELIDCYVVIKR